MFDYCVMLWHCILLLGWRRILDVYSQFVLFGTAMHVNNMTKRDDLLKVDTLWLSYGIQSIVSLGIGHDVRDLTRRVFQAVAIELTQFEKSNREYRSQLSGSSVGRSETYSEREPTFVVIDECFRWSKVTALHITVYQRCISMHVGTRGVDVVIRQEIVRKLSRNHPIPGSVD